MGTASRRHGWQGSGRALRALASPAGGRPGDRVFRKRPKAERKPDEASNRSRHETPVRSRLSRASSTSPPLPLPNPALRIRPEPGALTRSGPARICARFSVSKRRSPMDHDQFSLPFLDTTSLSGGFGLYGGSSGAEAVPEVRPDPRGRGAVRHAGFRNPRRPTRPRSRRRPSPRRITGSPAIAVLARPGKSAPRTISPRSGS